MDKHTLDRSGIEELTASDSPGENPLSGGLWQQMNGSQTYLWRSKISWRITMTVFATLLLVQTCVLIVTVKDYERDLLNSLRDQVQSALVPSLENQRDQLVSPITRELAEKLFTHTIIKGIAVYGLDYTIIEFYGEPTLLTPRSNFQEERSYRSADQNRYEVILSPSEISRPYNVVIRMNADSIQPQVVDYIRQTLIILMLMSGFVTSVLMLALGQWLLEPIILLRNNLLSAARNPEKPDLQRMKRETRDEIGIAIRIANDLIRQNANNIKRLRSQAEDKIHKLAYFDPLTGLPNRTYFIEKLEEQIKNKVLKEDKRLVVLSVDLDHFKDINDTMGHEIGDKLLEAIGKRLVKALPEDSIVARASADEFVAATLLRPEHPDSSLLVDRIFSAVSEPVSILQERFQVRVSIGVAQCPDDGIDARQIIKNADIALNRAKEEGRDTVRYYSQDFDRAVQQRFQLLRDLRSALDENQLQLHYHPQFDLRSGHIIGVEALLRWWKPDNSKNGGSFISPAEFIPVAEQSGLIVPIGEWVLKTACAQNKAWQERGLPPFRMAVNISGVQFHRADIVTLVAKTLQDTRLDPKWLELEVTESVFMENISTAIDVLHQLHGQGVELAVDDFGTGYSSLNYLRQFPIDRLKIDQTFIRNALSNIDDRMIAKTIITLGHSLNLQVIAEGVETAEHEQFLREEGCDEVQGFKYSKPLPADKLWDYVIQYNRELAKNTPLTVIEKKTEQS